MRVSQSVCICPLWLCINCWHSIWMITANYDLMYPWTSFMRYIMFLRIKLYTNLAPIVHIDRPVPVQVIVFFYLKNKRQIFQFFLFLSFNSFITHLSHIIFTHMNTRSWLWKDGPWFPLNLDFWSVVHLISSI